MSTARELDSLRRIFVLFFPEALLLNHNQTWALLKQTDELYVLLSRAVLITISKHGVLY